jgi:5-methylcytosine-specific restriction enzyme A
MPTRARVLKSRIGSAKRPPPSARMHGLYDYQWAQASKRWLAEHPLCAEHLRQGKVHPAECVDHVIPHRGNRKLFWDRKNWQSLCISCNSKKTAKEQNVQ